MECRGLDLCSGGARLGMVHGTLDSFIHAYRQLHYSASVSLYM